jgi:DNA-binding NtrC family response regulator
MSITNLKPPSSPASAASAPIRGTGAQDVARQSSAGAWYRRRRVHAAAGGAIALAAALVWLMHGWLRSGRVVSHHTLEPATVSRGDVVQDAAARGTVIAAVSPTLSATAPGTVTYLVHAGDRVSKGEVLARLSSPELQNQYEREHATLESMDAALAQQRVELQQELLENRQRADLAAVTMSQQLRELQRLQAAWTLHVISEHTYEAAYDTYSMARLQYEHANQNAGLERERILLELRTRQLARNAQALLVDGLRQRLEELTVRSPVEGMVADLAQPDQSHVASSVPLVSEAMHTLVCMATQVAHADVPVLITGPNGAGKEVLADIIHANSSVRSGPYLKVNLGALPQELIEAELFGTEAGAFTGAKARIGRFEAANGGTLFLDELGNLAPAGQAKLLRVLQTGELERLGSNVTRRTQVRMIAATNTDLRAAIRDGRFREDLYYRLNVIELELPPLARRREDILPLARHFLGGGERELSAEAERALLRHSWPGNVRELQNVIRRACLLSATPAIGAQSLGLPAAEQTESAAEPAVDRAAVEQALQRAAGVVAHAARELGLSRQALYRRMEKLGIKPD